MNARRRMLSLAAAAAVFAGLLTLSLASRAKAQSARMPPPPKGQKSGAYFKNVTTATLKETTPSDFMGAMGVMTAALGFDCSNCHPGAGTDAMDFVTDMFPRKVKARKMVDMVAAINTNYFGGAQVVTCWTCHHGIDVPTTSIALDKLYGEPNDEKPDVLRSQEGAPPASQIFDAYIQAVGGTQKVAALKSYIATGTSRGYAGMGGTAEIQIFAQAPDSRGMWIHFPKYPDRGVSAWTFDGKAGWINQPRSILTTYELTGNDLAGARLDAVISFPAAVKGAFNNWRVVADEAINSRDMSVVQGSSPGGSVIGTLYFDKETRLLKRFVRRTPSPVGRITIQQDFADYRNVDGIKFPHQYSFLWLDGRFTADITEVKVNVPIDAAKFARP